VGGISCGWPRLIVGPNPLRTAAPPQPPPPSVGEPPLHPISRWGVYVYLLAIGLPGEGGLVSRRPPWGWFPYPAQPPTPPLGPVQKVTGQAFPGEFGESLRDGVILCKLVNVIKPGSIKKVHESGECQCQGKSVWWWGGAGSPAPLATLKSGTYVAYTPRPLPPPPHQPSLSSKWTTFPASFALPRASVSQTRTASLRQT
jgi:hypothetical protein